MTCVADILSTIPQLKNVFFWVGKVFQSRRNIARNSNPNNMMHLAACIISSFLKDGLFVREIHITLGVAGSATNPTIYLQKPHLCSPTQLIFVKRIIHLSPAFLALKSFTNSNLKVLSTE